MAGTFSQIYIQYVFAVKGRENLLQKPWRDEVFKYMAGIIKGKNQKPIIVNGMSDHVHVFVGLKPAMAISDLIRNLKIIPQISSMNKNSSKGNFPGKRAMVYFHMLILKLIRFINTLPIKKNITGRKPSRKNTWTFFKNLKSNTKKNFCLSGWVKSITPSGFPYIWFALGLYYFHPFRIIKWTKYCSGFPKDDLLLNAISSLEIQEVQIYCL